MNPKIRRYFPLLLGTLALGALAWAVSFRPDPPADFRFVNGDEIKTIDPANVTGAPEGRIIRALFEGLLDWHPKTLEPVAGVAEYPPDISPDQKVYTFHIRRNAVWVDAEHNTEPITAHDFVYSWRRFLDPVTASEYASLLYYIEGAENYNTAKVEDGDPVEIELPNKPEDPRGGPRGELLRGKLIKVDSVVIGVDEEGEEQSAKIFVVDVDGKQHRFSSQAEELRDRDEDVELCKQVLPDFSSVGIKAVDDRTLQIKLSEPVAYFEKLLGFYPLFPVNQRCIEAHGYPAWTKRENLVSNGPFLLDRRTFRDRIRLRKNPNYWDADNIHLETMDALAVSSDTTQLNLYETGQVDWIITVPSTAIPELMKQERSDFKPPTQLAVYYYLVNCTKPPLGVAPEDREKLVAAGKFDELAEKEERARKVRRALALALDNGEVVEKVARAGEQRATGFVPPGIAPYQQVKRRAGEEDESQLDAEERSKRNKQRREQNIKAARALLAEAGYPEGRGLPKIEILYNASESHEQIAELIQAQWQEAIKIDSELIKKDWSSYLSDQRLRNYFVSRSGWIGDYVDPYTFLELLTTDHAQNRSGWVNPFFHWLSTQSLSKQFVDSLLPNGGEEAEFAEDETENLLQYVEGKAELTDIVKAKLREEAMPRLDQLKAQVDAGRSQWAISTEEVAEIDKRVRDRKNWQQQHHESWVALEKSRLARLKRLYVAEKMLVEHAPVIPIYFYVSKAMCRPYVKGWHHNLQDVHPYRGVRVDRDEKAALFKELGLR